ncbi:MAG TPA: hypothetical protein VF407_06540, partial [Polyangiaceae bacterium]
TRGNPIPKAQPDDHEDVSWALSTAEATWNRGDRPDALKWLRRAAEAASEAEADDRALELAKAAAEIATRLEEAPKTEAPPPSDEESIPVSMSTEAPAPASVNLAVTSPALVPQRPPKAPPQQKPPIPPKKPEPFKPKAPAAPAAAQTNPKAPRPADSNPKAPAKLVLAPPSEPSNSAITRAANSTGQLPAAPHSEENLFRPRPGAPPISAPEVSASDIEESGPVTPRSKRNTQNPTAAPGPDEDMEAWPTQAMSGNDLPSFDNIEDRTRIGTPAYREPEPEPSMRAHIPMRGARPSQAVRVIVWRGPDGVHVAPYGTTVSAISVDAMLVALDPSADLSAWLSNK